MLRKLCVHVSGIWYHSLPPLSILEYRRINRWNLAVLPLFSWNLLTFLKSRLRKKATCGRTTRYYNTSMFQRIPVLWWKLFSIGEVRDLWGGYENRVLTLVGLIKFYKARVTSPIRVYLYKADKITMYCMSGKARALWSVKDGLGSRGSVIQELIF